MAEVSTYDLNLIFDPNLSESQLKTEKDAVLAQIERVSGELVDTEDVGNKRLAYPIRKLDQGYYLYHTVKFPPEAPRAIETALRQRDNVMRVMTVRHRPEWRTRKEQKSAAEAA